MGKALWQTVAAVKDRASQRSIDWRHKISDHVAYGLLFYTGINIVVTLGAVKGTMHGSIVPYFSLIVLVGAIIPACRSVEKRWERLTESEASDVELVQIYRRDRLLIWAGALGLPFVVTGLIKAAALLL